MGGRETEQHLTPPNRLEVLQSLRVANVDVAFATAFATLVTGAFIVGFIQHLGGKDLWIGLLSAIPSLAGLFQIPGAIWGRSFPTYKRFILPGAILSRAFYLPLLLLIFLPFANELRLTLLALCILVASIAGMMVNSIYNDWLAEMVPADSRGFFFAKRNAIAAAVGAAVGLLGAVVLDYFRSSDQEDVGFAFVFGIAFACAGASLAMFMRMRDVPRSNPVRESLLQGVKAIAHPFRDKQFRKVLVFLALFTLGQVFAGNLFVAYALETLKLDFKIIQIMVMAFAAGNVLSARYWGFLSDKYGNKPMLLLVGTLLATNPLPWILSVPGKDLYNAILLIGAHVFMGAIWGCVALCQFNLMLATAKPEDRANYIGAGLTVTALVGGFGPLLGATMMNALRHGFEVPLAYKLVFTAAIFLRVFAMFFLLPVQESGAASLKETLSSLRRMTPRNMRAMRSLQRTGSGEERAEAIHEVGSRGVSLASDEIIKALHDPLPSVRRQAAMAIARLHDPRAAGELIHQIEEHPDLLEEETIEALGALGSEEAVPALCKTLSNPSPLLRRAAARALGKVAKPHNSDAELSLLNAAADRNDADLRRAALQALRVMGATEAAQVFREALKDPLPSVRIAAAEAIAELAIAEAAPDLRDSIAAFADEASSEAAYALGVVGNDKDIPLILAEAANCQSMITRRRCLLGVAIRLGVEQEAYKLLLKDGMERDTAIAEMLAPLVRRNPSLRNALDSYANGNEAASLAALTSVFEDARLQVLARQPIDELFLVAACYVRYNLDS
jgi:HEAT repeat protein